MTILGRSEELVSRCVECDLAEPESLASLGGSAHGVVDGILSPNLRLDPPKGEDQPQDLTSDVFVYGRPNPDGSDNTPPMSIINFDDLLGRTFLLPMDENGERKRATVSEHVRISVKNKSQEKISSDSSSRLMEINLMTSFHITNLWNT